MSVGNGANVMSMQLKSGTCLFRLKTANPAKRRSRSRAAAGLRRGITASAMVPPAAAILMQPLTTLPAAWLLPTEGCGHGGSLASHHGASKAVDSHRSNVSSLGIGGAVLRSTGGGGSGTAVRRSPWLSHRWPLSCGPGSGWRWQSSGFSGGGSGGGAWQQPLQRACFSSGAIGGGSSGAAAAQPLWRASRAPWQRAPQPLNAARSQPFSAVVQAAARAARRVAAVLGTPQCRQMLRMVV